MDETAIEELDLSDAESFEEVQLTAAQVIEMMEEAWVNEKFAPEILPHKMEVVDCLLGQIAYMEENLQSLACTDFRKSVHQLEVDRLRFLVSSYLRTRLEKIETYVTHILKQEQLRHENKEDFYLSKQELKFAKEVAEAMKLYFDGLVSFYPGLPMEEWMSQPVQPNMHSFVFLKSKKDVNEVVIDDGTGATVGESDLVDFREGAQILMAYSSVAGLLKKGDVKLI
nr:unnamed protein product [Callosobruchus chinensis]